MHLINLKSILKGSVQVTGMSRFHCFFGTDNLQTLDFIYSIHQVYEKGHKMISTCI